MEKLCKSHNSSAVLPLRAQLQESVGCVLMTKVFLSYDCLKYNSHSHTSILVVINCRYYEEKEKTT